MENWYNKSNQPFGSTEWLEIHHSAKLELRKSYVSKLIENNPSRIVDLGCGHGLWLELFNLVAPESCEFVGIDMDLESLKIAENRSRGWNRKVSFIEGSIDDISLIPQADLLLLHNMFSYLDSPIDFLSELKSNKLDNAILSVRQYDGGLIRFGPMSNELRFKIESALRASVGFSEQFRYYDLDRAYEVLTNVGFKIHNIEFENIQKHTPFTPAFERYYLNTIQWVIDHISLDAAKELEFWAKSRENLPRYFLGSDLVASVS